MLPNYLLALTLVLPPQAFTNPTVIEFTASADHDVTQDGTAILTGYLAGVFTAAGVTPIATKDMGKPTPVSNLITYSQLNTLWSSVPGGTYVLKVAAVGPGGASVYSVPSVPFVVLVQGHTTCGTLTATDVCVGGSFQIAATHDGANTTDYLLFKDGVQVATALVGARVNGEIVFTQTLTAAGSVVYRIDARGSGGTTASAPVTVVAKAVISAPAAPAVLRIIRITP